MREIHFQDSIILFVIIPSQNILPILAVDEMWPLLPMKLGVRGFQCGEFEQLSLDTVPRADVHGSMRRA